MANKSKDTEEQIFEAACRVFHKKGYYGARMQEIADEAQINKSMLHYYYRSKDKLFAQVYQQAMSRFFPVVVGVLEADAPLDEKIGNLIETYYRFLRENPRIAQFIIQEINQNPDRLRQFMEQRGMRPPKIFFRQVREAADRQEIADVAPEQLMVSIVGLILFPFFAGEMLKNVLQLDEAAFREFLSERKEFLLPFILNGIKYRNS